ncbi:MAG: FKBP-type peptidyl-prolyl cis-trans isomerase [Thermodesulfobacteriota bacterium]
MAAAKSGSRVKVHYTGKLEDGTVFDTSVGQDPLEFELGKGQVISGFDDAVTGMETGQSKDVNITPDKAYGDRRDELIIKVEKDKLPDGMEPQIGQILSANHSGNNSKIDFTVVEIGEKTLTLDANHALAGKNLVFTIELLEISS